MVNDDLVGEVKIPLFEAFSKGKKSGWEDLFYMGRRAGSIQVDIEFYSNANLGIQQLP